MHSANYYPYGKILREYANGEVEKFLTTQHERDLETGLDFRGARFYDSDVGRFLSLDPAAASFHSYSAYNSVLGNPLALIDPDGRRPIDPERRKFLIIFGQRAKEAVKNMEGGGSVNKFKGIYIMAQRRQENGMGLDDIPNNNPMNIKSKGDLGYKEIYTHEHENGKDVYRMEKFGNFSTVEKGFQGYIDLMKSNYPNAYATFIDNSKNISDFGYAASHGTLGVYATDPDYAKKLYSMTKGIINDYKKLFNEQLATVNIELSALRNSANRILQLSQMRGHTDPSILFIKGEIKRVQYEKRQIKSDIRELHEFEKNEGFAD